MKGFTRVSQVLQLLAIRQMRVKNQRGQFEATATKDGLRWCWKGQHWVPLDAQHFHRAASKRTGFQDRCKKCDNRLKSEKRRAPRIEVESYSDARAGV